MHSINEARYYTIGLIEGTVIVAFIVYTEREDKIRIISARQANKKEEKLYYDSKND